MFYYTFFTFFFLGFIKPIVSHPSRMVKKKNIENVTLKSLSSCRKSPVNERLRCTWYTNLLLVSILFCNYNLDNVDHLYPSLFCLGLLSVRPRRSPYPVRPCRNPTSPAGLSKTQSGTATGGLVGGRRESWSEYRGNGPFGVGDRRT